MKNELNGKCRAKQYCNQNEKFAEWFSYIMDMAEKSPSTNLGRNYMHLGSEKKVLNTKQ